jgi:hypothetical protein
VNALLEAWLVWQRAAGPWQGWSQCPPLLSPEAAAIEPRRSQTRAAASRIATQLRSVEGDTGSLWLVDLEPSLGVHVAAELNAQGLAHPVLVLPRWPYARAVLGSNQLVWALLHEVPRLTSGDRLPNVAFVLDGQRARLVQDRRPDDPRADNRHTLSIFDLPNLATLRARGIGRIVRVSQTAA